MAKTLFNVFKKDAVVKMSFTEKDIVDLQKILLKHMSSVITLDTASWDTIESLCERIDRTAEEQNQFESREVDI